MIDTSAAYKEAIRADARRVRVRLPLTVVSPDLVIGAVSGTGGMPCSRIAEIHDGVQEADDNYASLEPGRWILDGSNGVLADDGGYPGEAGYVGSRIARANGTFAQPQVVTMAISGVASLQVVTIFFPGGERDGTAADFEVEISAGGSVLYRRHIEGNTAARVVIEGFSVANTDEIRLSIYGWSIGRRYARVIEIVPGYAETWTEDDITSLLIRQQVNFPALATPYGTMGVTFDNSQHVFDPRDKTGVFASLEERQALPAFLGVDTAAGATEWVPCGIWYRNDRSWESQDNGLTMRWSLVDIIGLLSGRAFIAPGTLPSTLEGWAAELVAQLGVNFAGAYHVDPDYAATALSTTREKVDGKSCGQVLQWICQASGTFARADAETGALTIEPNWSQGNEYDLDNLSRDPVLSDNDNVGSLIFDLSGTAYVVSGNLSSSANTINISNPFITTQAAANAAAQRILSAYGGNRISTQGRGDPSSEMGDVVTVEMRGGEPATGRLVSQTLDYQGGVLRDCRSEMIQADGIRLYENVEVIRESGTWTVPAGVSSLAVILVGGGQAGGQGEMGSYPGLFEITEGTVYGKNGARGAAGAGGNVWYGTVSVTPGQTLSVVIGAGGTPQAGAPGNGQATTLGAWSSASGHGYNPSFTDIATGMAFGRSGISKPLANSGDGGRGGAGGAGAVQEWAYQWDDLGWHHGRTLYLQHQEPPQAGALGAAGGSGCVIVSWEVS